MQNSFTSQLRSEGLILTKEINFPNSVLFCKMHVRSVQRYFCKSEGLSILTVVGRYRSRKVLLLQLMEKIYNLERRREVVKKIQVNLVSPASI